MWLLYPIMKILKIILLAEFQEVIGLFLGYLKIFI